MYKEYDFDPHHLPNDVLAAIGLAMASSAQTESVIDMAIAGCLGVEVDYGAAVTTHMPAPLRDSVLRAVAEIRIDDLDTLDELDRTLDHIRDEVQTRRNAIVHHTWCRDPITGEVFTVKQTARGSVDAELIPMPISKIESDAELIYEAGMKLMLFLKSHNLFPPFPAQPRARTHKTRAARKRRRRSS
ncbi:MAG TPA: hypothetical protein VK451_06515 [Methyloceanibacter sp.]|nr:hypothetical protein [Methyloceanibacter sp.]